MIPKLHKKGASFKGAAAYLLHDKGRAATSERVAWAETRNLATDDPGLAWRIMAATALDQDRLKAAANIKATGRKSADHVLHFTLSWHPDEIDTLSRDEMRRAATGALKALGAGDRQALVICHSDEKHPHVHVLVNRVSPDDGRLLSSSKEKLKLSRWAQAYEEERGAVLCEERVLNNAARDRGEFTRAAKDRPRHIIEAERAAKPAANDNHTHAEQLRRSERDKDAALSQEGRALMARLRQAAAELESAHLGRTQALKDAGRLQIAEAKTRTRAAFRPLWRDQQGDHRARLDQFEAQETKLSGRLQNALSLMNLRRRVRLAERKPSGLGEAYRMLSSHGARRAAFLRQLDSEKADLWARQRKDEAKAIREARGAASEDLEANRRLYLAEHSAQQLAERAALAKLRAQWKQRTADRSAAWKRFAETHLHRPGRADRTADDKDARAELLSRDANERARQERFAQMRRSMRRHFEATRTPDHVNDDRGR